jgi:alkyl hydroperoxide reductase subunit F
VKSASKGGRRFRRDWSYANSSLFIDVLANRTGEIVVDNECRTGVAGVFACGDVTNVPYKQVVVAAGEGAKAALSAYNYLISQR